MAATLNTNVSMLPLQETSQRGDGQSDKRQRDQDAVSADSSMSPSARGGIQHRKRDFYSESMPVPSIQRFFKRGLYDVISSREKEEEEDEGEVTETDDTDSEEEQRTSGPSRPASPSDKHAELSKESNGRKERKSRSKRSQMHKIVDDPITQKPMRVHDISKREYEETLQAAAEIQEQKSSTIKAGDLEEETAKYGRRNNSRHLNASNALTLPFPPVDSVPRNIAQVHRAIIPLLGVGAVITLLDLVPALVVVVYNFWLTWWIFKKIQERAEDARWDAERQRGVRARQGEENFDGISAANDTSGYGIKESAEWLNALVDRLWGVMNPDLFSSLGQTLEDVMQASVPRFIHAVKIEDLAQGSTPLRVTGFRVLPDAEAKDLERATGKHVRQRRRDEKRGLGGLLGIFESKQASSADNSASAQNKGSHSQEKDEDDSANDVGGAFINLEISFVYRASPTNHNVASKSRNAHLLIKFWLGLRKIATAPLPVLVEIRGMVGTVRARIQLTPDPPFFKNVTFCFVGLPRIGVDVLPLNINTANIPILAGFVQSSMDAAMGEYCAPSSLTMDVGEILMGDNIKREVYALGIVLIYIHAASDLEKQDVRGSSDPYCTLQFSKSGRVLYATRVALNDLSPRWEERHVILINPAAVDAHEKISIGLWDSDRLSADDMLGRAEVDLQSLVRRPGRLFRRKDTLIGLTQEMSKQGQIEWSIGYYAKTPNRRRLVNPGAVEAEKEEVEKFEEQDSDIVDRDEEDLGSDAPTDDEGVGEAQTTNQSGGPRTPGEQSPDAYDDSGNAAQTRHIEHGVAFEPPSPALPSGILSIQIHSIAQLECITTRSSKTNIGKRAQEGAPGQDIETVENQEDQSTSPSSYFRIIMNDETVFQSRAKALSSNPFFNAGTERFISDWRRCLVMIAVYDRRLREDDALLGVVPLKLIDVFTETSQVTTVFPIAGGVGRGQMRLSLLFRPIQGLSRRQEKLGWNIGTVQILAPPSAAPQISKGDNSVSEGAATRILSSTSIHARTLAGKAKISSRRFSQPDKSSTVFEWRIKKKELPFSVPARRRYAAPLILEFVGSGSGVNVKRKVVAMSIIWLQDVPDDITAEHALPIWRPKPGHDFHRLLQCYHDYRREEEAELLGVEKIGQLILKMRFKSGVGHAHTRFDANPDAKVVMDAWRACASVGLRSVAGDFTEMRGNIKERPIDQSHGANQSSGAEGQKPRDELENEDRLSETASADDSEEPEDEKGESSLEAGAGEVRSSKGHNNIQQELNDNEMMNTDDSDDKNGKDESSSKIFAKVRKWTEERKELHRQHRGIKQYKAVRTASWMGHNVKEGGNKFKNSLTIQDRRVKEIESEL